MKACKVPQITNTEDFYFEKQTAVKGSTHIKLNSCEKINELLWKVMHGYRLFIKFAAYL